ncbi:PREDICTED: SPX domain-containing protein 1-like [Ipomoea nil]|uniref:SPX domain-containing protein 1-like n=1 Tax=Ipomoea nil TaxID=35883 RepID=UPI000901E8E9|nr:PREDICTED: SPX domain-containing protein 1-like [Ipomoea nil]XP_019174013.1 PREDICTED: SPX domain-containing protein 1-like [Ipomoea nil]
MKFSKRLRSLSSRIEEVLPEWEGMFLSYKDLKKQLKVVYPKEGETSRPNKRQRLDQETEGQGVDSSAGAEAPPDVTDFETLLGKEIEKFNGFFMDKEEEYVIRLKVLKERVADSNDSCEKLMKVGREIVDLHGEMVLLENYSALNYTGLVKILKKYDKCSGALLRLPFIQKVLEEPFFNTDVLKQLMRECETLLRDNLKKAITENNEERPLKVPEELAEIENVGNMYLNLTNSALQTLEEIRSGSSTVSAFSLPPLHRTDMDEAWKKSQVVEQAAK